MGGLIHPFHIKSNNMKLFLALINNPVKTFIIGLIILLGPCIISACNQPNIEAKTTNYIYSNLGQNLEVYTIDSCQYIGHLTGCNHDVLAHKGDCTNPKHYRVIHDTIYYELKPKN